MKPEEDHTADQSPRRKKMFKVNLKELLPIQQEVNRTVVERIGRNVTVEEFILAFNVELFEYLNAIGT